MKKIFLIMKNNIVLTILFPIFSLFQLMLILIALILNGLALISKLSINTEICKNSKYSKFIDKSNVLLDKIFNNLTGKF